MRPSSFLTPKAPELVPDGIIRSLGEATVLALAEFVVSLSYLPY